MLMFAGKVHHLRHFGLCDLVRKKNAVFADSMLVDVHHDAMRRLVIGNLTLGTPT
jgi:hypothetical protein